VLLTNASGNIVRSYKYDVSDQVSNPPSVDDMFSADPYANRFLYTGREFLKEANLYDYRNRVYSAELGRFLQTDPIRFEAGDGNLYRYVGNNGVNLIDPLGLESKECIDDAGRKCCCDEMQIVKLHNYTEKGKIPHTFIQTPNKTVGYASITGLPYGPGKTRDDSNHERNPKSKDYKACPETVAKLEKSMDDNDFGWYSVDNSLIGRNCTGWACGRLQDAGFTPPAHKWQPGLTPWQID
jgi:RHS repeat-associated protein